LETLTILKGAEKEMRGAKRKKRLETKIIKGAFFIILRVLIRDFSVARMIFPNIRAKSVPKPKQRIC